MEYSELVSAVKENKSRRINEIIEALRPRLISFLRIHMNATYQDAEDCAHDSLIDSFKAINSDRIKNPDQIVSYIFTTCRNNYLKKQKKRREETMDDVSEPLSDEPGQLQSILSKEEHNILKWCISQLKKEYQDFIEYWFSHPDASADVVANEFDISVNNAWTRKHRLKKELTECLQKKSDL